MILLMSTICITSVLRAEGSVVGAVAALLAEVDVSSDAALQQRLGGTGVVTHTHEDLIGLVLAEEAQGVHLWEVHGFTGFKWVFTKFSQPALLYY